MLNLKKKEQQGFTLVEVLLAVFILSVGISGILLLFVNSMTSSELAWDMTVATTHAEDVLEEMQARKTIADITSMDWTGWVEQQGIKTLPEENIQVMFPETMSNPVAVFVDVSWKRKQREHNVSLKTKFVK